MAELGAQIDGLRVILEDNREVGILVADAGARVSLSDAVVRNTLAQVSDGTLGRGVQVSDGALFSATRSVIERNRDHGVLALDVGTEVELSHTIVRDTAPRESDGAFGRGVGIQFGPLVRAVGVVIERSRNVGVFAEGSDTVLTLEDAVIRDTESQESDGTGGQGIHAQLGARVDVSRAILLANRNAGLIASNVGTRVTLSDVAVRGTRAQESGARGGHGVHAQFGASIEASRTLVADSRGLGVVSFVRATVEMTDIAVIDVAARECATTSCPDAPFGYGANAVAGTLDMTRFAVSGAETCGLFVGAEGGSLDVRSGIISGSTIGACVQVVPYDFMRLTNDVAYRDNGTNLDATSLPVPTP